jgi:hypothetical protein
MQKKLKNCEMKLPKMILLLDFFKDVDVVSSKGHAFFLELFHLHI